MEEEEEGIRERYLLLLDDCLRCSEARPEERKEGDVAQVLKFCSSSLGCKMLRQVLGWFCPGCSAGSMAFCKKQMQRDNTFKSAATGRAKSAGCQRANGPCWLCMHVAALVRRQYAQISGSQSDYVIIT